MYTNRVKQLNKANTSMLEFDVVIKLLFNLAHDHWEVAKLIDTPNRRVRNYDNQVNLTIVTEMVTEIQKVLLNSRTSQIDIVVLEEVHLSNLVLMSGGNQSTLWRFLYEIFGNIEQFPVTQKDVNRTVSEASNVFQRAIRHDRYKLLAEIHLNRLSEPQLHPEYDWLLKSRAILRYDNFPYYLLVSPLVQNLYRFKEAVQLLRGAQ